MEGSEELQLDLHVKDGFFTLTSNVNLFNPGTTCFSFGFDLYLKDILIGAVVKGGMRVNESATVYSWRGIVGKVCAELTGATIRLTPYSPGDH